MRTACFTTTILWLGGAFALATTACSSSEGTGTSSSGQGGGPTTTTSSSSGGSSSSDSSSGSGSGPCAGPGFSSVSAEFTLPQGYTAGGGKVFSLQDDQDTSCYFGNQVPATTVMDVNADGRPDLVVMSVCNEIDTGSTHWRLYPGSATGFADTPTDFALPPEYATGNSAPFPRTSSPIPSCGGPNAPAYKVMDVTADGRPDLVVTQRCDDPLTGTSRWLVYAGGDSGFAATPTDFALPQGYSAQNSYNAPFRMTSTDYSSCNGDNIPTFTVLDLTADGRPDLVVTQRCNDSATGNSRWLVYPGGATGFADTPTDFELPPGFKTTKGDVFPRITGKLGACDDDDVPAYTLLDMTADGRPDMVVTQRCNDNATASSRWLVYVSGAAGFAGTPTDFALPTDYAKPNVPVFTTTANQELGSCNGKNVPAYALVDMNADKRPDLVVMHRCDDNATASSRWLVYPSGAAGFAAKPTDFALPPGYAYGDNPPFPEIASYYISCIYYENVPAYALLDMTADGRPDMVLMGRCKENLTGNTRWLVHPMCSP